MHYRFTLNIASEEFPDDILGDILSAGHPGPIVPKVEYCGTYRVTLELNWTDELIKDVIAIKEFANNVSGLFPLWAKEYEHRPVTISGSISEGALNPDNGVFLGVTFDIIQVDNL